MAGSKHAVEWRNPAHDRKFQLELRRDDQRSRFARFEPHPGGKPRRGKPTPGTTSLSRGASVRNWRRLLRRHGKAPK